MDKSFILYTEQKEFIETLSDEDAGRLFKGIYDYVSGNEPELDGMAKVAFIAIRQQIDRNAEKYNSFCQKQKANGSKGGRPRKEENPKNPTVFLETQKTLNDNVNVNVNDNDILFKNEDIFANPKIQKVFFLYKEHCKDLIPLKFEHRTKDRLIEVREFLKIIRFDYGYIEELFDKANKQKVFYDNRIDFQSLIKNHSKIYAGLGGEKLQVVPQKKSNVTKEEMEKWLEEIKERNSG